jgi:hypothetical protein
MYLESVIDSMRGYSVDLCHLAPPPTVYHSQPQKGHELRRLNTQLRFQRRAEQHLLAGR